jgi:hypothetical protein
LDGEEIKEVSAMNLREEIIKNLDTLSEDALEGVLEYIQCIQEPEEVERTEGDLKAIAQGEDAYAKGEYVRWRDIKTELNL